MKKWTQMGRRLWKNEGSTRLKIKEKICAKCCKMVKCEILAKNYTTFRSNYLWN